MKDIVFMGDIHGKIFKANNIIKGLNDDVVCVGDIGIGFRQDGNWIVADDLGSRFSFIHGNHDNPTMCAEQAGYLGRFGVTDDGLFYMSGAFSVDAFYRTIGIDWWNNEQLNNEELQSAYDLYMKVKPKVVVTHDCPRSLYPYMLSVIGKSDGPIFENTTAWALEGMFKDHQPETWCYGHWHEKVNHTVNGTNFICIPELGTVRVTL